MKVYGKNYVLTISLGLVLDFLLFWCYVWFHAAGTSGAFLYLIAGIGLFIYLNKKIKLPLRKEIIEDHLLLFSFYALLLSLLFFVMRRVQINSDVLEFNQTLLLMGSVWLTIFGGLIGGLLCVATGIQIIYEALTRKRERMLRTQMVGMIIGFIAMIISAICFTFTGR